MKRLAIGTLIFTVIALLVGIGVVRAQEKAATEAAVRAAMVALEEFMEAFNARDPKAWAATLNYPHVRIAGDAVRVWETEADYAAYMDFDAFAGRFGWDHSAWDLREVLFTAEDRAVVVLQFSRFNAANEKISTFPTLYLVTRQEGHWGIRARSSFAP